MLLWTVALLAIPKFLFVGSDYSAKKAHYFPLMTDIAKYWLVTAIIVQPGTLGDGDMSP